MNLELKRLISVWDSVDGKGRETIGWKRGEILDAISSLIGISTKQTHMHDKKI